MLGVGKFKKTTPILLGILSALMFAELILRFGDIFKPPIHITEQSSLFGFDHIPNSQGVYSSKEFTVNIKINSQGLRDEEINLLKQEGVTRIAVVGDSFIEGLQVPLEVTSTKILQRMLIDANEKVQVINFGVSGFGLDQKYLYIKNRVLKYHPDIVVLFLASNDLDDIKKNNVVFEEKGQLKFRLLPIDSKLVRLTKGILRNLYLANLFFVAMQNNKVNLPNSQLPIEYYLLRGNIPLEDVNYMNIAKKLILLSEEETVSEHSHIILVIGADRLQVDKAKIRILEEKYLKSELNTEFFNSELVSFASENNIEFLDLLPIFKEESLKGNTLYFNYDGHWNETGHRVVAQALVIPILEILERAKIN